MSDFFDKLQASINKNVKGAHASVMSESSIATDRYWVKTPALDLNRILSGSLFRGIQSRNLVGIVGPEHTMKTSFMILCMVEAIAQGKEAVIIDTEGAVSKDFCARWGLDLSKVFYTYTPFIDEIKSILAQIRDTGQENLIIGLDSVGGIDRQKHFEDALKGQLVADQGLLQKEIRGMLKLFLNVCIKQNSIGIATGHMYGSPSHLPLPDQVGGGKAMKLFPSILIQLKKRPLTDSDKKVVGSEIEALTLKNRTYPPFQTATVQLNYTDGIQPYAGILDLGIKARLIEQKGAWYSCGEERLGQGSANATDALKEKPKLIEKIDEWLKQTGYSTKNRELEQVAQELLEDAE